MRGINIRVKSQEAHLVDFKSRINFLDKYKLNEMIKIRRLQF